MNAINLMPAKRRAARARLSRLCLWGAGLAAYAGALVIALVFCRVNVAADDHQLEGQSRRASSEWAGANRLQSARRFYRHFGSFQGF